MRAIFLTVLILVFCPPLLAAADLTKVPRSIAKEPAYKSKPRYALLVFGLEAKFRVWLVFDGDLVYVDRNGNGDLTEPDERLEPSEKPTENSFIRTTSYSLPQMEDPFSRKKYGQLEIDRLTLKENFVPEKKEDKERMDYHRKNGTMVRIRLRSAGKITQSGHLFCAGQAAHANILYFDGPLRFQLVEDVSLKRGNKPTELRVELGSPGLGRNVYHAMSFAIAPKDLHPLAEIEFPTQKPGSRPIKQSFTLKHRC